MTLSKKKMNDIDIIKVKTSKYEAKLLNIGATLYKIKTPDKNNKWQNILLSHANIEDYFENDGYLGSTVGRSAGRIKNGEFRIDNILFNVPKNNNGNNLHSSGEGVSKRKFDYKVIKENDKIQVLFSIVLKKKHDHFPGDIKIKVIYEFNEENIILKFNAMSDADTICNITNHAYFNLSGRMKKIYDHAISDGIKGYYTLENNIPTKHILRNVRGTIRELFSIDEFKNGIDHPFIKSDTLILSETESGRKLVISTSYPIIVMYTQNFAINNIDGLHNGIAIEPQYLPNDINFDKKSRTILRNNKKYSEWIKYSF